MKKNWVKLMYSVMKLKRISITLAIIAWGK